jgi:hypothetical protein
VANNLAAFNAEVWSSRLVEKINQVNVMLALVNRNWEGDLSQSKTAKVRTLGNIAMSNYSTGGTISYQDLAPTVESFTVSDAKYFAFNVDDVDKAQTDINAMDAYIGRAVVTINNTIEAKLAAAYTSAAVTLGAPPPAPAPSSPRSSPAAPSPRSRSPRAARATPPPPSSSSSAATATAPPRPAPSRRA